MLPYGPKSPKSTVVSALTARQLLSHVKQQLPVLVFNLFEDTPHLFKEADLLFSFLVKDHLVRRLPAAQVGQRRWIVPFKKQLIEGYIQRGRQPFQSFERRDSMSVLNPGNVAAQQAGALFDVALRKTFFFSEFS